MARMEARVNLRLDQDVYDAYDKVAKVLNTSVTEMVREIVNGGVAFMHPYGAIIDAAEAGDKDAVLKLFDLVMASSRGQLDLGLATLSENLRPIREASAADESAGASNTAL